MLDVLTQYKVLKLGRLSLQENGRALNVRTLPLKWMHFYKRIFP